MSKNDEAPSMETFLRGKKKKQSTRTTMFRRLSSILWTAAGGKDTALRDRLWKQKLKEPGFNPDNLDSFEKEDLIDDMVRHARLQESEATQEEGSPDEIAQREKDEEERRVKKYEAQELRRAQLIRRGDEQRQARAERKQHSNQGRWASREETVGEEVEERYTKGTVTPDEEFAGTLDPKLKRQFRRLDRREQGK